MVKAVSLFSQLLKHIPRSRFAELTHEHGAERNAKGFSCWTQLVAMLFCHLAHADSLREICNGLACCQGKLNHVGVDRAPNKSTLSYANAHRPAALFAALFWDLAGWMRAQGGLGPRPHKFRFKNKLLSLDSTIISLCLSLFPWARFRRAKGGVKVHVMLDHDDYMPVFVRITEAREHDRKTASLLRLNPGSIVVMDKGYNDYRLYGDWTDQEVYFVTRLKDNADYDVVCEQALPQNRNILADQCIVWKSEQAQAKCPVMLRRVVVWDAENEREIVLLTNHLEFGATTIAAIYKERWQIELFFKALKQNLKIRTFVGTTENALCIQIWTALIAMLLLKWLHHLSRAGWSLSIMAAMLRLNLFTYRDLMSWLHDPGGTPPLDPGGGAPLQLELDFGQAIA